MKEISKILIGLKKTLLLIKINSAILDQNKRIEIKKIKKAIAAIKSGRIPSESSSSEVE